MDHSFPMVFTAIDFSMNAVPVKTSHWTMTAGFCLFYLIFNLVVTKIRGKPVYPNLANWHSATDVIFPLFLALIVMVLFFLLNFCQRKKMIASGHTDAVNIL